MLTLEQQNVAEQGESLIEGMSSTVAQIIRTLVGMIASDPGAEPEDAVLPSDIVLGTADETLRFFLRAHNVTTGMLNDAHVDAERAAILGLPKPTFAQVALVQALHHFVGGLATAMIVHKYGDSLPAEWGSIVTRVGFTVAIEPEEQE